MVREVRVALTVEDFEGAVAFYGEALDLRVVKEWDEQHGKGAIVTAGAATIEILDRPQAEYIDEVEAGERVSGPVTTRRLQPAPAGARRHAVHAVPTGR